MDVREKLVELLAGCPCESDCEGMVGSCPHRKNGNCNEIFKLSYCAVSKLAQHLIAHGVTVQEWISVKDRLPTIYDADEDNCVLAIHKASKKRYYHWRSVADNPFYFTHWMKTPKPPKGE